MTNYTLKMFLWSAENQLIVIENMTNKINTNQIVEKKNQFLIKKNYLFKNLLKSMWTKDLGEFELIMYGSQARYINHWVIAINNQIN